MWKTHKSATEKGSFLQILWWWDWREHVGNMVIKYVNQRESGKKWRWVGKGEVDLGKPWWKFLFHSKEMGMLQVFFLFFIFIF